jgi:Ca2+-binding RTX toxin-like protein
MTDDWAGDPSTNGVIQIGGRVSGTLEVFNDTDWFAIDLTAGQEIRITIEGNPIGAVIGGVFSADGTNLGASDTGLELNDWPTSLFIAPQTGRYYVEAAPYASPGPVAQGPYTLEVHTVTRSSGFDIALLTEGNDEHLVSGQQNDIQGLGGNDTISWTGQGSGEPSGFLNSVRGGAGDDRLLGFWQDSSLYGGDGQDWIEGGISTDMFGGLGNDTLVFREEPKLVGRPGHAFEFGPYFYEETISGGEGDDEISLEARSGHALDGLSWSDPAGVLNISTLIDGGAGTDTLYVGSDLDDLEIIRGQDNALLLSIAGVEMRPVTVVGVEAFFAGETLTLEQMLDLAIQPVEGTADNDSLVGTDAAERIDAFAGDDTIIGSGGADTIDGGPGRDLLSFEGATQRIVFLEGTGTGPDGSEFGFSGVEDFTGGIGNDYFRETGSDNHLRGLLGDDTFAAGLAGTDVFDGGPGSDRVSYSSEWAPVSASLLSGRGEAGAALGDSYVAIENLTGGRGSDLLIGDEAANEIHSGGGTDTIFGNGGNDTIVGSTLSNPDRSYQTYFVAGYNDLITNYTISQLPDRATMMVEYIGPGDGDGVDVLYGAAALVFTDATMTLRFGIGATEGNDRIFGSNFPVLPNAYDSTDQTLAGGGGHDVLMPGAYTTSIDGGDGYDLVDFSGTSQTVVVDLAAGTVQASHSMPIRNVEMVFGTDFADRVTGDVNANRFTGGLGDDTLAGGGGSDTAIFSVASSTISVTATMTGVIVTSAEGVDLIQSDVEILQFSDGDLTFDEVLAMGSPAADVTGDDTSQVLDGTLLGETIRGLGGSDWIRPGPGNDTIDGGAGSDMVDFLNTPSDPARSNLDFMLELDLGAGTANLFGGDRNVLIDVERATGTIFADLMRGDEGANHLRGQGDYDWFIATPGQDTIEGGSGRDMLSFVEWEGTGAATLTDILGPIPLNFSGVRVDLSDPSTNTHLAAGQTMISIERITGSSHQDIFFGDETENDFRGLGGYDFFIGSTGGRERYFGGAGIDTVSYFSSADGVTASLRNGPQIDGAPSGYGTGGDAALDLYFSIENLIGSRNDDSLTGNDLVNQLRGLSGDDLLLAYGGNDRLSGNTGDDTIDGGAGSDFAVFSGNRAEYELTRTSRTEVTVSGPDGNDSLINVEYFQFDDHTANIWELSIA